MSKPVRAMPWELWRPAGITVGTGLVCLATGAVWLWLASGQSALFWVWPPKGIALAALLMFGYRVWPGVFVGMWFAVLAGSRNALFATAVAAGSTVEGLVLTWLTVRFARGRCFFEQPLDIFKFALAAGFASLVSPPAGVMLPPLEAPTGMEGGLPWLAWWFGDMMSILVLTPLLLVWAAKPRVRWNRSQAWELGIVLVLLVLVVEAAFGGLSPAAVRNHLFPYLCLPCLVWIAFRFGPRETMAATALVAAVGLWGTVQGYGVFARVVPEHALLVYQGFITSTSILVLAVAAVVAQQKQAAAELREAQAELERRVAHRTEALQMEINMRQRAAEALRESEQRLTLLVQTAPVGIVIHAADGSILKCNAAAEKLLGLSEGAWRDWPPPDWTFLREDASPMPREELPVARVVAHRQPLLNLVLGIVRPPARETTWLLTNTGFRLGPDGNIMEVVVTGIDITTRKEADAILHKAHEQLERRVEERTAELSAANQALQSEIQQRQRAEESRLHLLRLLARAQETERGRISRELHDRLGQELTALKLGLQMVRKQGPLSLAVQQCVTQLEKLSDDLMQHIHRLAWELRPAALDDFGLDMALRRFVSEWSEQSGVTVDFHSRGAATRRLPAETETALYRVAQEALANVFRHAEARRVSVLLERRSGSVSLIVEDDGRGFDPAIIESASGTHGKLGLLGMRERVTLAGGTFDVESTLGSGTTIFVRIPLDDDNAVTPTPNDET